ncbi:MAG TPA: hypothetical protein VKX41_00580 [Alloacidobacterium sp.]|nr:hypothetical protein [Alloacidobacterium sp.]
MQRQGRRLEQAEDTARIDGLLQRLAGITQHGPPSVLRERLKELASQQLATAHADKKRLAWLKPAFATLLLIVAGFAGVLMVYHRQHRAIRVGSGDKPAGSLQAKEIHETPKVPSPEVRALPREVTHQHVKRAQGSQSRRMIIRLPYSNSAVTTGTDATIRVAMSQSELLSLGFPVNATMHDHRVLAELTLGADGLPRAVSLPLPLEFVKEKK